MLRELYIRAVNLMLGGLNTTEEDRAASAISILKQELADWSDEDLAAACRARPSGLLAGFPAGRPRAPGAHDPARPRSNNGRFRSNSMSIAGAAMTEVTIYTPDRQGLFSQLAGAMALCGASIVDARIFTLRNGKALDTFFVQDSEGGPFDRPARLAKLSSTITRVLEAPEADARRSSRICRRLRNPAARNFPVIPRVLIDNQGQRHAYRGRGQRP